MLCGTIKKQSHNNNKVVYKSKELPTARVDIQTKLALGYSNQLAKSVTVC